MISSTGFLSTFYRRPAVRLIALAATAIQATGCYVAELRPLPRPVAVTDPMVVHWNDQQVRLTEPRLEGDSVLVGWSFQGLIATGGTEGVPPEVVQHSVQMRLRVIDTSVSVRRFSGSRTALLVVGVLGALYVYTMVQVTNAIEDVFNPDCWPNGC
jgi:hypothetical protein